MAPQEWYTPAMAGPGVAGLEPRPAAAMYQMRPLSLGEVLDRTFSVYRANFWLFAGIGSLSAGLQALIGAVQLLPLHLMGTNGTGVLTAPTGQLSSAYLEGIGVGVAIMFLVVVPVYMLAFVVTQAATVFALGEVYLGKETTIGASVRATIGRWYRYLGIGIWQGFSTMWIPMVAVGAGGGLLATGVTGLTALGGLLLFAGIFVGAPFGVVLGLRNSLGVQATVIENLPVRASMRRSKVLTAGAKGRIFVVGLLAFALNYAASLLQMPLLLFVTFSMVRGGRAIGSEIVMLVVSFVAHAVVEPVMMIGLSLVYFDQRVRHEGFDLLMLLGPEPVVGATAMPVAVKESAVTPVVDETAGGDTTA
jgi:hypothetical protein